MPKYTIELTASITKDGAAVPMSDTTQLYRNLDYADVVAMEEAVLSLLIGMGKAKLADKSEKTGK